MNKTFDNVRRADLQKTKTDFLHDLLENSMSCSVAVSTDNYPLINVTFFVYDKTNNEVIFHFSKNGFGGQEIVNGKKAAISIYKFGKLYTAERAVEFGCEYQSVIIYGVIKTIDDENEKLQAMELFFNKYFGHVPSDTYQRSDLNDVEPIHVIRVKIDKWFGKEHFAPEQSKERFYSRFKPTI